MNGKTRRALELFVERADELEKGGFIKYLGENRPITLTVTSQDDGMSLIEAKGPDDDATKAMIATIRPFMGQRPISFGSIVELCDDPGLSSEWKSLVVTNRNDVNSYLDNQVAIVEPPGELLLTRRAILDIFIYGKILHIDDDKKHKIYEKWQSDKFFFLLLTTEFYATLAGLARAVFAIAEISKSELAK
jgi:hypothetical protein